MRIFAQGRLVGLYLIGILAFCGVFSGTSVAVANSLYVSPTNYAESKTVTSCGTSNTCSIAFHKVGASKTLLLTHVSCRIVAKSTVAPLIKAVLADNSGQVRENLTPVLLSTDGQDIQYFQSNNEASTILTAAMVPQIAVTFDGSIPIEELTCSLGGQFL